MLDYVKYKNELNTISFGDFNTTELDLFFSILSQTKNEPSEGIYLKWRKLKSLAHYTSTSNARFLKDLNSLNQKLLDSNYIHLYTDDNQVGIEKFRIFETITIMEQEKVITAQFNQKFTCLLNQIHTNDTCFLLEEFISLKRKYSKNLYRLLKQVEKIGEWKVSFKMLSYLLSIPKSYQTGQIDQKILKPALEELSAHFNHLNLEKVHSTTKGNRIDGYIFRFDKVRM